MHNADCSAIAGVRSKYGLNNRSAVQVIEDALSTSPEINHPPVATTSPTYHSQTDFASSFSPEQAQPSPQIYIHAPSQAIVPSGGNSHSAALLQIHTLLLQCHLYCPIPAVVLILFTLGVLPQGAMATAWTLHILLRFGQASVSA